MAFLPVIVASAGTKNVRTWHSAVAVRGPRDLGVCNPSDSQLNLEK
jgi:hypothetical protein